MEVVEQDDQQFNDVIAELADKAHGRPELEKVRTFLKTKLPSTEKRTEFLKDKIFKDPIEWEVVKTVIWPTTQEQEDNRYFFLQGDVIVTTRVLALGISETSQTHKLWLVLSPDCDCVRGGYIRVAPVFDVKVVEPDSNKRSSLGNALKIKNHKLFPIPSNLGDGDVKAHYADMEVPYYITEGEKSHAVSMLSLTEKGWHLLNALLQENQTRTKNMAEAVKIRSC